eukprot:TRINITY_DN3570_c0_g2_i2.p2 TRINITY_DN3570_c0_g2~~TRINITY_DN3570_c0_g2_i2.p2  ORF type:complete len:152 (-),score=23.62 TRINITY_DN3570_c0_g2_i2:783-1238(-)
MDLYLHVVVMHMPTFYEVMDFRNVNTERAEGFLAKLKRVLSGFTNRNLKNDQPLREVLIRHVFKANIIGETEDESQARNDISKAFQSHKFDELVIEIDEKNHTDVLSLIQTLNDYGYTETNGDWKHDTSTITFNTLKGVQSVFDKYANFSF